MLPSRVLEILYRFPRLGGRVPDSCNRLGVKMKWIILVFSALLLIGCGNGDNNTNYPKPPKRYVTVDVLNIREGPGTNFRIIGTRKALEYFVLLEEKNNWSKICIPGHLEEGWVWSDYLASTRDNAISLRNDTKVRERKSDNHSAPLFSSSEMERKIQLLKDSGVVTKVDPPYVYVETYLWNAMDFQLKKDICAFLANYCGWKRGTSACWVEIKDKYSGRKLAKYGVLGFKVY